MKRYIYILLVLALLLCACAPAGDPSIDGTTEPSTSQIIEPTGTGPTSPEDTFVLVQHKTGATYDGIDTTDMKDGALYAIENGKVSLITTDPTLWCFSDQHIYYCNEASPGNVWRRDRKSGVRGVCFQIDKNYVPNHSIVHIQFQEKLLIKVENNVTFYAPEKTLYTYTYIYTSEDGMTMVDMTPLVQAHQIDSFTYASSSTAFPEVSAHISDEDLGTTIYWTGKIDGRESTFYSFVDRGECWDAANWEQVGYPQPTNLGWTHKQDGRLYYIDGITEQWHLVFDGPVIDRANSYNMVFFVKEAEPTKIYAAPISDLTQHRVVYESQIGAINYLFNETHQIWADVLQFVEGNKRFVWLDLTTSETEVLMEQYYLEKAYLEGFRYGFISPADSWQEYLRIYFYGKLNEGEPIKQYLYYIETGKIEETIR